MYVRFQSPELNRHGINPGVFGLTNHLGRTGRLTEAEERFWKETNAWYEANFTDPSTVDPAIYDRDLNPKATAWFKASATHLIDRVKGYLEVLEAHDVKCVRVESTDPGRVIYEDDDQVVVVPYDIG